MLTIMSIRIQVHFHTPKIQKFRILFTEIEKNTPNILHLHLLNLNLGQDIDNIIPLNCHVFKPL